MLSSITALLRFHQSSMTLLDFVSAGARDRVNTLDISLVICQKSVNESLNSADITASSLVVTPRVLASCMSFWIPAGVCCKRRNAPRIPSLSANSICLLWLKFLNLSLISSSKSLVDFTSPWVSDTEIPRRPNASIPSPTPRAVSAALTES